MRTEQWLENPELFIPVWKDTWTPDPRMLDFEEKWEAFHTPDGRVMTCAHRGDVNIYYPENSLEGFYSAILAGADIVEVDTHTTKDGQLVIMHDDALTRTTNVFSLRERGIPLPPTDQIADWTLAQIKQLRLVTKDGVLTEYAVPALSELIRLAKDKVFITLDKWHAFSWEDSVYPLIQKLEAYRTVLIVYDYPLQQAHEIRSKILRETGIGAPFFAGVVHGNGIMSYEKIEQVKAFLDSHGMPPVLRGGEFLAEERTKMQKILLPQKGKCRIYAETLRREHDTRECWQEMAETGCNIIMGNRIYDLLEWVKQRHFSGEEISRC